MSGKNQQPAPWYRHAYVWLLIAFPLAAVIGGFVTLGLAIVSDDGLVADDYYQRGKEINRVLKRDRRARALGMEAVLEFDYARDRVTVTLLADDPATLPASLSLGVLHPTRSGRDHSLNLRRTGEGTYQGQLPPLEQARWHVQLEADDWRLVGTLQVPAFATVHIVPLPLGPA